MVLGCNKEKWIHSEEVIMTGKVTYHVKFVGVTEVDDPRGMDVVRQAMQKLKFSRHIKRSEGMKPPKVDLTINVHGLQIIDQRSKTTLHDIPLHRVSFCADDRQDKRLFSFIAKGNDGKHYCYGLDSLHEANSITLTIGQAFELSYEKFLKSDKAVTSKQVIELSRRIELLEKENSSLKRRIQELESSQQEHPLMSPLTPTFRLQTPPARAEKDVFDMKPFTPSPTSPTIIRLPSPSEVLPIKSPFRRSPSRSDETSHQVNGMNDIFHAQGDLEKIFSFNPDASHVIDPFGRQK